MYTILDTIITLAAESNELKFGSSSSCYKVTITEARANDANTDFEPSTSASSAVVTTACTRSDGTAVADSSDLRYSVLDGSQALFSIGEFSGVFMVAHEALDYEEQSSYLVHILCYLDSDRRSNATGAVNVTVAPLNEYLPQISQSNSLILSEHEPVGTRVAVRATAAETQGGALPYIYNATDKDRGPDGIIKFLLTVEDHSSYNQDIFDLDAASGTLILKRQLDVDKLPGNSISDTLDVTITACNADTAFNTCQNIVLFVYIVPADDNKPQFIQPNYTAEVLESTAKQTVVLQVACKDEDKHKTLGSLTANAIALGRGTFSSVENVFDVNSTGAVILKGELDYEKTTNYLFELTCSDGNTTTSTEISVAVLPVNDNAPQFINNSYKFILESEPAKGSPVGQVEARDDDIEIGSVITYSMEKNSYFVINNETGEIYYIHAIVQEKNITVVMVTASDGKFTDQTMAEFILLSNNSAVLSSSTAVLALAVFISLLTFLSV